MDLGSVYGDGLSSGFPIVETDTESIQLPYNPIFGLYSLDMAVDQNHLLYSDHGWLVMVDNLEEFSQYFEEVD